MGTNVSDHQRSIDFFRSRELLDVIDAYEAAGWQIRAVPGKKPETGVFKAANYMNNLLSKISERR